MPSGKKKKKAPTKSADAVNKPTERAPSQAETAAPVPAPTLEAPNHDSPARMATMNDARPTAEDQVPAEERAARPNAPAASAARLAAGARSRPAPESNRKLEAKSYKILIVPFKLATCNL